MWDGRLRSIEPTPEKLEQARNMRAQNATWADICRATGITIYILKCALLPDYKRHQAERVREHRARRALTGHARTPQWDQLKKGPKSKKSILLASDGTMMGHAAIGDFVVNVCIPEHVERDRQRRLSFVHRDLTAALMGDPPIFRSALGKKNGWQ